MKNSLRWPVGIAVIYIFFMVVVIGVVIFSTYHKVDLVSDDYYEQEMRYQQQIDRIERAGSLSKSVEWIYDQNLQSVTIQFPSELYIRSYVFR